MNALGRLYLVEVLRIEKAIRKHFFLHIFSTKLSFKHIFVIFIYSQNMKVGSSLLFLELIKYKNNSKYSFCFQFSTGFKWPFQFHGQ